MATSSVEEGDDDTPLIQAALNFVKEELKKNDASHDFFHILRVWKLARTIAQEEVCAREKNVCTVPVNDVFRR